jgi:hypothetical protein
MICKHCNKPNKDDGGNTDNLEGTLTPFLTDGIFLFTYVWRRSLPCRGALIPPHTHFPSKPWPDNLNASTNPTKKRMIPLFVA